MSWIVCRQSVVPLRRSPDLTSELTSQVLCGEVAEVLEPEGMLARVRLLHDGYEGYADLRQFTPPADSVPAPGRIVTDDICGTAVSESRTLHLLLGTPLPRYADGTFRLGSETFSWHGHVREIPRRPDVEDILRIAARYAEAPYEWGGRTLFGIDCSGFTQAVFRAAGYPLLRDTTQQITQGSPVPSVADSRPGDLVFCAGSRDRARHVGLVLPEGRVMHASAMVRIDDLTAEGFCNPRSGLVTHHLMAIRRIFG